MSHVDKGALHAYLDGALDEFPAAEARRIREHLERCSECADRLVEERRVRDDAAAMLGLAAPAVEMPSFEELRAYVQATRAQRPPGALRLYRMGWAASVVLALGAGWMLRGGQLTSVAPLEFESLSGVPRDGVEAPSDLNEDVEREGAVRRAGTQPDQGGATGFADAGAGASSTAAVVGGTVMGDELASGRADVAGNVTAGAAAQVARQAVTAPAEPPPAAAELDVALLFEQEDALLRKVQTDAVAEEAVAASQVSAELVAGDAAVPTDVVADLPTTVPDLDSVLGGTRGAADPSAAPEEQRAARSRAETLRIAPAPAVAGALADERRLNEDVPESDADDVATLGVPGLEVVYIEALGGATLGGVHVLQRYGDEQLVDVYRIPADIDPDALLPVSSGRAEVRRRLEDGQWIVLRATLTEQELAELVSRFDPEG